MVRQKLAKLVVASAAVTMVLGIAGATIVVPASSAGAATSPTSNFQCACNPYLYLVETEVAGLPLVGNFSPELATVFTAVNTAVAAIP
jgi:hypothetical protein